MQCLAMASEFRKLSLRVNVYPHPILEGLSCGWLWFSSCMELGLPMWEIWMEFLDPGSSLTRPQLQL